MRLRCLAVLAITALCVFLFSGSALAHLLASPCLNNDDNSGLPEPPPTSGYCQIVDDDEPLGRSLEVSEDDGEWVDVVIDLMITIGKAAGIDGLVIK